ncbi:metallophosphoesterase family protein [Halosimplex salinum]|uniref:metallophosphoesterase family protein n=1 Tax=Halosimplex salinum TaxID=1710538 RepID=UPI000F494C3E|nr:metallophosphoesterase family protein [Halosimplex salinum]
MRVGVISDIHGNLVALEAVLEDMPPVDRLVCAGDIVGYNPWHAECVAAIRGEGEHGLSDEAADVLPDGEVPTVMGNHDRAVAFDQAYGFNDMAATAVDHARETCSEDQLEWLGELPEQRVVCDRQMRLVHGHPDDPDRYTYPEEYSADMLGNEGVLVTGHTHVQGHEIFDEGLILNPGAVGQPRDGDPRAAYSLVDFDTQEIEARRVEYDVDRVVDAVREADLPLRIGTRLRSGQ